MSVAGAAAVPGVAHAESLTDQANHLRREVVKSFGSRAPGRDIVRRGILERHGKARRPTHGELIRYRDALSRMLAPAPSPTRTSYSSTSSTSSPSAYTPAPQGASASQSSSTGSGAGNLPACTWQPESGGDWNAVNSSSGAGGRYQIMPGTWAAYGGTGSPQDASPAEQTAVAERIMQSQGPSAWSNC